MGTEVGGHFCHADVGLISRRRSSRTLVRNLDGWQTETIVGTPTLVPRELLLSAIHGSLGQPASFSSAQLCSQLIPRGYWFIVDIPCLNGCLLLYFGRTRRTL